MVAFPSRHGWNTYTLYDMFLGTVEFCNQSHLVSAIVLHNFTLFIRETTQFLVISAHVRHMMLQQVCLPSPSKNPASSVIENVSPEDGVYLSTLQEV